MVAFPLFAHITQCVLRGTLVKLVEDDQFGVIEHVDFFQLALCTKIGGHDVASKIHHVDDFRIRLADTGGFHDDQVETGGLEEVDRVVEHRTGCKVLTAGRHRAHVNSLIA